MLEQLRSGGGQFQPAWRADEERDTQLLLQIAHGARQRRLVDVHAFGSTAEIQLLRDRDEVAQMS